ncbi:MAG: DUF4416 family protein [Candidatus Eremiobacteraeota bacterium]|nr:DUF4416 family protein [Candidatus Eremiobacteraeota bacterium]
MSTPRFPQKVKLFLGMLASDPVFFNRACDAFSEIFGPIDYESETVPFNATNFYLKEMGKRLLRKFCSFGNLILPDEIIKAKYLSAKIEKDLAKPGGYRNINIDPGYVCLGKIILSSFKDHQHRIYLGNKVYAECTLRYRRGRWDPWEWTFPDYRSEEYNKIFKKIREIYYRQIMN